MSIRWRALAASAVFSMAASAFGGCTAQQSAALPSGAASVYQSSYRPDPSMDVAGASGAERAMPDPLSSSLGNNQTVGFGGGRRLLFTYQQQFDCVVQSGDDRDYSGKPADLDPGQFASPECQADYPSTIDPTGRSVKQTDPLYVMLPFFETNKKTPAFSKALGKALKKLFGFVPDAFKPNPGVAVQCPAPKDKPGTCTMHPLETDLGPLLTALGLLPKDTNLYVPLPNHDHLLSNKTIDQSQEWWQVIVVLVEDPKAWPNAAGTTGITSVAKLRAAQVKKQASGDIPTNFFLFFSSKVAAERSAAGMPGMRM